MAQGNLLMKNFGLAITARFGNKLTPTADESEVEEQVLKKWIKYRETPLVNQALRSHPEFTQWSERTFPLIKPATKPTTAEQPTDPHKGDHFDFKITCGGLNNEEHPKNKSDLYFVNLNFKKQCYGMSDSVLEKDQLNSHSNNVWPGHLPNPVEENCWLFNHMPATQAIWTVMFPNLKGWMPEAKVRPIPSFHRLPEDNYTLLVALLLNLYSHTPLFNLFHILKQGAQPHVRSLQMSGVLRLSQETIIQNWARLGQAPQPPYTDKRQPRRVRIEGFSAGSLIG